MFRLITATDARGESIVSGEALLSSSGYSGRTVAGVVS